MLNIQYKYHYFLFIFYFYATICLLGIPMFIDAIGICGTMRVSFLWYGNCVT
jgi:hypothetical protein